MSLDRESATEFVASYGQTWESWDIAGFAELFSDDVVYVVHPTDETVVGREALKRYVIKEKAEQGSVSVRMGKPIVDGDHVAAEFWATTTKQDEQTTIAELIAGCGSRWRIRAVVVHRNNDRFGVVGSRSFDAFDVRIGKTRDGLGLAVVGDRKLILTESLDGLARFICNLHVNPNQIR